MHKMLLLKEEVTRLREANQILSQRRRAKKRRVRHGGHLSFQDALVQESQKDVERQLWQEERAHRGRAKRIETRERRCGRCNNTGHNSHTCKVETVSTSESKSN